MNPGCGQGLGHQPWHTFLTNLGQNPAGQICHCLTRDQNRIFLLSSGRGSLRLLRDSETTLWVACKPMVPGRRHICPPQQQTGDAISRMPQRGGFCACAGVEEARGQRGQRFVCLRRLEARLRGA